MSESLEALENLFNAIENGYRPQVIRECNPIYNTIKQDLEMLKELKQVWSKEEWCEGIPLSAKSLKSLFNYNEELFDENLELDEKKLKLEKENKLFDETIEADDRIICQLTSELDIFKLAFYTLWKCCNSNDIATDVEETDNYLEFRCGYESLCIPVTEQEIESIKKATELLDINVNEVLGE